MPTHITDPISLPPNPRPNTDLRIQLHAHLKIPLKRGLWNLQRPAYARIPLEPARDHGIVVTLLVGFVAAAGSSIERSGGRAIDGFVQDWVLRVVLFHGGEVVRAFKEVLPLAGGVFGADGLAIDALC